MRASLNNNVLPQADAVRVEELINYFPYDYAPPQNKSAPFEAHVSMISSPWNTETKLMRIGIKGYELPQTKRPRSNLAFLIDSSGSNERSDAKLTNNGTGLKLNSLR